MMTFRMRAKAAFSISAAVWLVFGIYIALRVVQWVLSLPTIVGPDSHSFLPGSGLSVPPHWYVGFEKVSLSGDGAIRPWTVTVPYAVLLTDYFRSFAQMLLSAGSFVFLADSVRRSCRSRALSWVLALIILTFSLATLVTGWDMLLNRESIAISLTVLVIAMTLRTIEKPLTSRLAWLSFVGVLALVTRPTLAPLVLPLVGLGGLLWIRSATLDGSGSDAGRNTVRRVGRAVIVVLVLIVSVAYPVVYSSKLDMSWTRWYGHSMSETQFGYVLSDYNPRSQSLIEALPAGTPPCLIDSLPVYTGEYVGAPWGFAAAMRESCPGFSQWYQDTWPNWYYRYVMANPDYIGKLAMSGIPLALHPWDTTRALSALPVPARDLFFPAVEGDEGLGKYEPIYLYWTVTLILALVGVVGLHRGLQASIRRHWALVTAVGAILIGSILSIVLNLLLIPSYPLETNRVNVSTALALRLTGPIAAVTLVWMVLAGPLKARIERLLKRISP